MLTQRRDCFKQFLKEMNQKYEALKRKLQENETHAQVRTFLFRSSCYFFYFNFLKFRLIKLLSIRQQLMGAVLSFFFFVVNYLHWPPTITYISCENRYKKSDKSS